MTTRRSGAVAGAAGRGRGSRLVAARTRYLTRAADTVVGCRGDGSGCDTELGVENKASTGYVDDKWQRMPMSSDIGSCSASASMSVSFDTASTWVTCAW